VVKITGLNSYPEQNTTIMYCTISIKILFKQLKHKKLINLITNQHFQTLYLKKFNNHVRLADALFGCNDSVNWHSTVLGPV
jgi:hypothetical protein